MARILTHSLMAACVSRPYSLLSGEIYVAWILKKWRKWKLKQNWSVSPILCNKLKSNKPRSVFSNKAGLTFLRFS